jgi:hypothetical protein
MKKLITRNLSILILSIILIISTSIILFSYPGGITGRTKKTSTVGCSCHTQNTAITGAVTGPDTVNIGSTNLYTITINRSGYSGAHGGVDIAVRLGTLSTTGSNSLLQLLSGELTQVSRLTFSGGTVSVQFTYVAPSTPGIDTIWSNVVAGYSNGWNYSPEKRVVVMGVTGIEKNSQAVEYKLNQNYPNPFNPKTVISFSIPKESNISLIVYDILGNRVADIFEGKMEQGNHEVSWNAANFSSGIYFYTLKTEEITLTKKMILAK